MAKTQKYTEDQLLDAVVRFSEVEKKKIKATELAKWCRLNIDGLEEVRDYHFMRPIKEKDPKTGNMIERKKSCTLKIEEINNSRSLAVSINTNLLLRSSNIDTFMEQPDSAKRRMIVETRETVDKLLVRNGNITRENEALKLENGTLKSEILNISDKINNLQKAQDKLAKQVVYLMKATDEANRKSILSQMGIEDEDIDLDKYTESLQQELSEIIHIDSSLQRHLADDGEYVASQEQTQELSADIMSGLDF